MIWACEISSGHSWYKVLMNLSFNQLIYLVHVCSVCCSLAVKSFQSFQTETVMFFIFSSVSDLGMSIYEAAKIEK